MDRAKNVYELFKNNDILENITDKNIENYIKFADQLFGDGMGRRFMEVAGVKVRKRKDGTRSRVPEETHVYYKVFSFMQVY